AADSGRGSAFVLEKDTRGVWGAPVALALPVPEAGPRARVGSAVLLHGDTAYVGAPGAGVVVVLARDAAGAWSVVHVLRPPEAQRGAAGGSARARRAEELWVGAPAVNESNGRVYRFARDRRGRWEEAVALDADSADGTA